MSAQGWFIIGIVGFSLTGVFLIISTFIFIRFDIPSVLGYLTGRTAAKQIKEFRQSNTESGNKNVPSDSLAEGTSVLSDTESMTALSESTTVLTENPGNNISVFTPTGELKEDETLVPVSFQIVKSMIVIHTKEAIE